MLHLVIATKQPSMTAATLAAAISQAGGRLRDTERIVELWPRRCAASSPRSPGNVLVALPVAVLVGWRWRNRRRRRCRRQRRRTCSPSSIRVRNLLVAHAAIAGIWLFLTGLVAGYLDNRATSSGSRSASRELRWLGAVLGERRAARIGRYLAENAGGLGGNLFVGLSSAAPAAGVLLGLPLDIRHVAFSSANLGTRSPRRTSHRPTGRSRAPAPAWR